MISKNVNSFDKTVENFDSFDKSTIAKETHSQFVKLDKTFKSTVTKVNSNDSPVNRLRNAYTYSQSINANDYILKQVGTLVFLNSKALDEIVFWKENVAILNGRDLSIVEQYSCIVYSDASGIGFGGYAVSISDTEVMGSWNSVESLKSSTWRELEAVYRVLLSLLVILQGETIKWYTDNQNIVYIIKQGSRKGDLQLIAIKIANVCKLNNIVLLPQNRVKMYHSERDFTVWSDFRKFHSTWWENGRSFVTFT
ncbi:unnamed protein product [Mytilus coruscus]|uniref:RNase H type-1 domain-containing protein n=1 Tax=Mytilus coruscus TaxID=42192 RepID=A0A6J8B705_MYTCO|nr:unnamed protein product [Mytilus coruscus]